MIVKVILLKMNNIVFKSVYGSYLYGLNTDTSDIDLKQIYVPSIEDCILSTERKIYNYKNYSIDFDTNTFLTKIVNPIPQVDLECIPIQKYIDMLMGSQSIAIDMLHTPDRLILLKTDEFKELIKIRTEFYSKQLVKTFLMYSYNQSVRNSNKGLNIKLFRDIVTFLKTHSKDNISIHDLFISKNNEVAFKTDLEYLINTHKDRFVIYNSIQNPKEFSYLKLNNIKIKFSTKVKNAINILNEQLLRYKDRSLNTIDNDIDFKAYSHCLRVIYLLQHIIKNGDYEYPLPENDILLKIKTGDMNKKEIEDIKEFVKYKLIETEKLILESSLPDKISLDKNKLILMFYKKE